IDRFAIGQGLQVALLSDWRIGSARCRLQIPELKTGIAATFGSILLEVLLGRARMLELIFNYDFLDATTSRALVLLNQVVPPHELQAAARARAETFQELSRAAFVATKRVNNRRLIDALEAVRAEGTEAHVEVFRAKARDALGKMPEDGVRARRADEPGAV